MKKQLTVFAAAAIFASFATAALAATPNITMTGTFKYNVEYNVTKQTWDGADNGLNYADTDPAINFSVATAGDPNLGSIGVNLWFDGANSDLQKDWKPSVTLAGGFYGGTLKLGQVSGNWDGIIGGTDGAGAEYVKTVNNITFDALSAAPALAGRASVKLSDTNSVFGGVTLSAENKGIAFGGGSFAFGPATVGGQFAAEMGDDSGTALKGTATIKPIDTLTLTGTLIKADKKYVNAKFIDTGDIAIVDNEFNKLSWAATHFPDGANLKVRADYVAIKDVMSPYVEYKSYAKAAVAPDATAAWKFGAGTNFAPIFLTSASVSMDSLENTEFVADFNKTISGVGVEVKGAFKTDKADKTYNYGFVKASKSFQWVSTWAFFGTDAHAEKYDPQVKVGAQP